MGRGRRQLNPAPVNAAATIGGIVLGTLGVNQPSTNPVQNVPPSNPPISNSSKPVIPPTVADDDGVFAGRRIHAYFNHEFQKMRGALVDVAGEQFACGSQITELSDLLARNGCPPLGHGKKFDHLVIGYYGPPGLAGVARRRTTDGIVSVGFRDRHIARVDIRTRDIRLMCSCEEQVMCSHRMAHSMSPPRTAPDRVGARPSASSRPATTSFISVRTGRRWRCLGHVRRPTCV